MEATPCRGPTGLGLPLSDSALENLGQRTGDARGPRQTPRLSPLEDWTRGTSTCRLPPIHSAGSAICATLVTRDRK